MDVQFLPSVYFRLANGDTSWMLMPSNFTLAGQISMAGSGSYMLGSALPVREMY